MERLMKQKQIIDTLRAGKYAWPGGYPLFFIAEDGAPLSFEAVRENLTTVLRDTRDGVASGYRLMGVAVNYEDQDLYCDLTNQHIEAAYDPD